MISDIYGICAAHREVKIRCALVPAASLRRWLRLSAYAPVSAWQARYEGLLEGGWSEEWPLVLRRRADGVTKIMDGRHRLRAAADDLWVPSLWLLERRRAVHVLVL